MEMKDCVQACVTLSNYMELINMQMVALLAKNMILQTVLSGQLVSFPFSTAVMGWARTCTDCWE